MAVTDGNFLARLKGCAGILALVGWPLPLGVAHRRPRAKCAAPRSRRAFRIVDGKAGHAEKKQRL
eukprot:4251007-Pyramimonas_sp.AAC.1